jgi:hypothetical protein
MVLVAQDVGEHGPLAVLLEHQAHGHARDGGLERHARVHHRQGAPAHEAIEDDPFDSVISDTTRSV